MWNTAVEFFFARPFMMYHFWVTDSVIPQYYPNSPKSSFLISDLNGAMINTNFILDYPRLQPQTFINVGGMQISEKPKELPKVSINYIDNRFTLIIQVFLVWIEPFNAFQSKIELRKQIWSFFY